MACAWHNVLVLAAALARHELQAAPLPPQDQVMPRRDAAKLDGDREDGELGAVLGVDGVEFEPYVWRRAV
eukprot:3554596-Rhodomonas_salina.1